jgi:hypothetical protein
MNPHAIIAFTAGLLASAAGRAVLAAVATPTPHAVLVRPDLTVATLAVARAGLASDGAHVVRVSVTVCCGASAAVSSGAFKILLEHRDGETAAYTRLGEAGVASLSCGGATATAPTATRTFDDRVPAGAVRTYRATVDSAGQVTETNEGNNRASTAYRATGCAGTDLVLTRVELTRTDEGGSLVHVWVRNRCLSPCVSDIYYVIDEHEALPGSMGVEQRIGGRIEGESEVGPMGTTVAAGRPGMDAAYTVRVEARGGSCAETSTANNSCRATIRAGETGRTVTCSR